MHASLDFLKDFPVGICIIDSNYHVKYWNKRLAVWVGIQMEDIIGKDLRDFFPHLREPHYKDRLDLLFEGGSAAFFSPLLHKALFTPVRPSNHDTHNTTAIARPDDTGEEHQIVFVIEDVSALSRRTKQLEKSNQQLREFTDVASHDLKAPLRRIRQALTFLRGELKDDLEEIPEKFMGIIANQAQDMEELLNALMLYSKAQSSSIKLAQYSVQKSLNKALSHLAVTIEETGTKITYDTLPKIKCDRDMMNLLFQNLISNSIKYTEADHPQIHITAEQQDENWLFCIEDNGIGIPDKYIKTVFQPFKRLHTTQEYPGTGIGLATCKNIIDRHNGKIWATSEPGKGSKFYFLIPA